MTEEEVGGGAKKKGKKDEECHQRAGHYGVRVLKERQTLRVDM